VYQWIKSLFIREPKKEEDHALEELERRIRMYKRVVGIRLSVFEDKHGRLSVKQRSYLARKIEKRIQQMREEHSKKYSK